jgi:hypothetical protein
MDKKRWAYFRTLILFFASILIFTVGYYFAGIDDMPLEEAFLTSFNFQTLLGYGRRPSSSLFSNDNVDNTLQRRRMFNFLMVLQTGITWILLFDFTYRIAVL